jgi:hypothetical protein
MVQEDLPSCLPTMETLALINNAVANFERRVTKTCEVTYSPNQLHGG